MGRLSLLVLLVGLGASTATFYHIGQALDNIIGGWLYGSGDSCGSCPPAQDCRDIPAIVLGYCCGCALPIDRVPVICAPEPICPPNMGKLCSDYNYLMDCCCWKYK